MAPPRRVFELAREFAPPANLERRVFALSTYVLPADFDDLELVVPNAAVEEFRLARLGIETPSAGLADQ